MNRNKEDCFTQSLSTQFTCPTITCCDKRWNNPDIPNILNLKCTGMNVTSIWLEFKLVTLQIFDLTSSSLTWFPALTGSQPWVGTEHVLSDREITPYFCWTKALDSLLAGFSAMISRLVCEFVATIYSSTKHQKC